MDRSEFEKSNILVVDDRAESLTALELILDSSEYNLVRAYSGEEALRRLLEMEFALILLDVRMPGMDGFETAKYIKQREKTRTTPIIFITAYSDDVTYVFEGYSAGAVDYIFKPIDNPVILKSKVAVFVDLHRKSKALREAEEKYRNIFQHAIEGMYQVAADGHYITANPSMARILKYESPDRMIHKVRTENLYCHPGRYKELLEIVRENGSVTEFVSEMVCKDGAVIWVSENARAHKDSDGNFMGYEGTLVDITVRRKSEELIRKNEMQLAAAQQIAHLGSWEWDLRRNTFTASVAFFRICGSDQEDFDGSYEGYLNFTHEEDRALLSQILEKAMRERKPFSVEHRIVCPDGTLRNILAQGEVILDSAGKQERILGTALDITERKRAEEKLRRSHEQLRALSAHLQWVREEERTRIAREIHDELGQSLTGLKMDISWLEKQLAKAKPDGFKHMSERIDSVLSLIDKTIQTVREISAELRPAILDLGVTPAIEWQAQEFQKRTGIRCNFSADVDQVDIDRDHATAMFRILQETLTNIVRHAKATEVDIALKVNDGFLMLKVKDNGRGITEAESYDLKSLGLLGMRERALIVGGRIEIEGTPEQGTSVRIFIPLRSRAENARQS
jgi:PAS domain S-box-containing protein